jgi:RNA polymerase sigma factor (sigma-70 family)
VTEEHLAAEFETHRPYLHAIAFHMLGSHADADDAGQEAWLRLARTGGGSIENLRGWLTTVTGRICLDALRRRSVRAEQPLELSVGTLPREAAGAGRGDPEDEALLADSVGLALYVVMDALTPAERVSFVLHDMFEVPFDAIAAILGRSTAATKMLAGRARGRIRLGPPAASGADAAAREVVDAFLAAATSTGCSRALEFLERDGKPQRLVQDQRAAVPVPSARRSGPLYRNDRLGNSGSSLIARTPLTIPMTEQPVGVRERQGPAGRESGPVFLTERRAAPTGSRPPPT